MHLVWCKVIAIVNRDSIVCAGFEAQNDYIFNTEELGMSMFLNKILYDKKFVGFGSNKFRDICDSGIVRSSRDIITYGL